MQHAHRVAYSLKHLVQAPLAVGYLLEARAAQLDPGVVHPLLHHLRRER
jgi:hypothetical protein